MGSTLPKLGQHHKQNARLSTPEKCPEDLNRSTPSLFNPMVATGGKIDPMIPIHLVEKPKNAPSKMDSSHLSSPRDLDNHVEELQLSIDSP